LETQTVKTLLKLLNTDAVRAEFITLGGPITLLPMLVLQSTKNFHLHSRIVSLLGTLLSTSTTPINIAKPENLATRDTIIPGLVSTTMDDDEALATNACVVLAVLLIDSLDVFEKAVKADELDIEKAVVHLVNLLERDDGIIDDISALSVLQVLGTILTPNPESSAPITVPPQTPQAVCKANGAQKLVARLSSKSQPVREETVRVLSWLTTNADVRRVVVAQNGLLFLFAQTVSALTLTVQERTLAVITHFAADSNYDTIHGKLVEGGAVQVAVTFLGVEDMGLLSLAMKAVLLFLQHPQCKAPIIEAGGVEYLNMHVDSTARSIQLASRKALSMLEAL